MPRPEIHPSELRIQNFQYVLPDERIAKFPLTERDQSKLLIYQSGNIQDDVYRNLSEHIPSGTLLLFNQTKVIHARLYFQKKTGGKIEVFCLEPDARYPDVTTAMMQVGSVYWKCLLKGASKWKDDSELFMDLDYTGQNGQKVTVHAKAKKVSHEGNSFIIFMSWKFDKGRSASFSEFLEYAGRIPIPPYLKREAVASDEIRYQTIFAKEEGSVAAPTAALHFTDYILKRLKEKSIDMAELTLHVGAGTFMPVKSEKMEDHEMHSEWIEVSRELLEKVRAQIRANGKVVTIGTTSARTLESLYWIGVQMLRGDWKEEMLHEIAVPQWYPYRQPDEFGGSEAIEALIHYFDEKGIAKFITRTQLIIAPGYEFRLLDGLITNFHQPASTLLLMIAALVGNDWKRIYDYALKNDFRFLSYGDGSLLWKK